jgi:hypothetical protein
MAEAVLALGLDLDVEQGGRRSRLAHEVGTAQPPLRNVGEHFRAALFKV